MVNTVIYILVDVFLASFRLGASLGLVLEKTTWVKSISYLDRLYSLAFKPKILISQFMKFIYNIAYFVTNLVRLRYMMKLFFDCILIATFNN